MLVTGHTGTAGRTRRRAAAFTAFARTASAAALLGAAGLAVTIATAAGAFFAGGTFGFIAVAGVYVFVRLLAAGGLGLGRGGGLQQVFQFFELGLNLVFIKTFLELFHGGGVGDFDPLVLETGEISVAGLGHFHLAGVGEGGLGLEFGDAVAGAAAAIVAGGHAGDSREGHRRRPE